MEAISARTAGAVLGAIALASSGLAAVTPAVASAQNAGAAAGAAESNDMARQCAMSTTKYVAGSFTYSQAAITPAADISAVFCKAASALCTSLPAYGEAAASQGIALHFNSESLGVFAGGGGDDGEGMLMACSCSTNAAGGGAIANAAVSGTSVRTLSQMLQ